MNELEASLKVLLADSLVFAYKAQTYHWNILGDKFHMIHGFTQEIYEEVFDSIDEIGETIRMIDGDPPVSLKNVIDYSTLAENDKILSDSKMIINSLSEDVDKILETLKKCMEVANQEHCVIDLVTKRIVAFKKFNWMIKSHINKG